MKSARHNAPATTLREFIDVAFRPLTNDSEKNESIRRAVIIALADDVMGEPDWDNPLKRRVALEYITALTHGTQDDCTNTFVKHEKIICRRESLIDDEASYELIVPVPWLTPHEMGLIQAYVELAQHF